jgi:hypothetical protein
MNPLRLLLIGCPVLQRELELLAAESPHTITFRWLEIGLHERQPAALRDALQAAIDAADPGDVDAVLLGYALCNRGVVGLTAKALSIVIPRAHDCLGILLGSTSRYLAQLESEPGTYFQSAGWVEQSNLNGGVGQPVFTLGPAARFSRDALAEKYGEDNADYLLEQLAGLTRHYQRLAFIDTPVPAATERAEAARGLAAARGWRFERLPGDLGWLRRLVNGEWNEAEFLRLEPGRRLVLRSDERIMGSDPA